LIELVSKICSINR